MSPWLPCSPCSALGTRICPWLVRGQGQTHSWNYLPLTVRGGTQQQRKEEWIGNTSKDITQRQARLSPPHPSDRRVQLPESSGGNTF